MKLMVLIENTTTDRALEAQDGLSLYIEAGGKKILFDMGADRTFMDNAKKLGIDLGEVDTAVISHAHYDHAGGLAEFLRINTRAKVYIGENSLNDYYLSRDGEERYIGIDPDLKESERLMPVKGDTVIGEGLKLVTADDDSGLIKGQNTGLCEKKDGCLEQDMFRHEQNLLVSENGRHTLVTGCAHRNIVNIIRTVSEKENIFIEKVIGGFHLKVFTAEELEEYRIADKLDKTGARFITGHCTGIEQYNILKENLGNRISSLSTGLSIGDVFGTES